MITLDMGEILVIQRALHIQKASYEPSQREKIFHTRYTIGGKVCERIIDGGNSTNASSTTLIDKLQLPPRCILTLSLFNGPSKEVR